MLLQEGYLLCIQSMLAHTCNVHVPVTTRWAFYLYVSCACKCNYRLCLLVMCLSAKQGGGAKARGDLGDLHEGAGLYGVRGPEQAAFRHELG